MPGAGLISWLERRSRRQQASYLLLLWLLSSGISYAFFGYGTSTDSVGYLQAAQALLAGEWPAGFEFFYSSYAIFLALLQSLGLGLREIVWVQYLSMGLSAWVLLRLSAKASHSPAVGLLTATLYLCWLKVQQWNSLIYTDALFTHCIIYLVGALYFYRFYRGWLLCITLLFFTVLLRPPGLLLIPALGAGAWSLLPASYRQQWWKKGLIGLGLSLLLLILINTALQDSVHMIIESYSRAEVIYPKERLGLEPPEQLASIDPAQAPLWQLAAFIWQHPLYWAKLFGLKTLLFLANIKPYFSWYHNLAIIGLLWPLYGLAVVGYRQMPDRLIKHFSLSLIVLMALTVGCTSENWDGRFLIPLLPWVFVLAAQGICTLLNPGQHTAGH